MASNTCKKKRLLMEKLPSLIVDTCLVNRQTSISYFKIEQEVNNKLSKRLFWWHWSHIYRAGSLFEGMPQNVCNDEDVMFHELQFPIVLFKYNANAVRPLCLFRFVKAEQNPNAPLYFRLKVPDEADLSVGFRGMIDNDGYLKTKNFIQYCQEGLNIDTSKQHGPSVSFIKTWTSMNRKESVLNDVVFCMKCLSWPSTTNDFFTRKRPNNWPSQELLHTVARLECLVVPIGQHNSTWKDTEWRLSFSLAEAELIHKMQEPYIKCMYCLKALKNKYIVYGESDQPTPFCSYFIKTACLWMCEQFPHEEYSFNLMKKVIDWIIDCYQHRNLQHYFIPQQNLIGHLSRERCDEVIEKWTAIKGQLWTKLMSSIPFPLIVRVYINEMCDKLNITRVDKDEDYTTLETNLLKHPRTREELTCVFRYIRCQCLVNEVVGISRGWQGTFYPSLLCALDALLEQENSWEIFKIPEEIIIPIIHNIHEIVFERHMKLFKHILYRFLGDVYTYLLVHFRRSRNPIPMHSLYWSKPLKYYKLGIEMFPDKVCEIGGHAVIVIHHYLMSNYTELNEILTTLTPRLLKISDDIVLLNRQFSIAIPTAYTIALDSWATDNILHNFFKSTNDIPLHPIALVLYINARVSLREGKLEIARLMVKELHKCLSLLVIDGIIATTKFLVKIIQSLIGLIEVMNMIMDGQM